MINIIKIKWLSHISEEAIIVLSDGNFEINCFSHPFKSLMDFELTLPLSTLNANNIKKVDEQKYSYSCDGNYHYLTVKVIDKEKPLVVLGDFKIELDNILPYDISEGDFIFILCDRLDIF